MLSATGSATPSVYVDSVLPQWFVAANGTWEVEFSLKHSWADLHCQNSFLLNLLSGP